MNSRLLSKDSVLKDLPLKIRLDEKGLTKIRNFSSLYQQSRITGTPTCKHR